MGAAEHGVEPRLLGKALALALLFGARPEAVVNAAAEAGFPLPMDVAAVVVARWAATFPVAAAALSAVRRYKSLRTPSRALVIVPPEKRYPAAILAGIAQAWEAEALRAVLIRSDAVMAGTGAVIVLANHDEVVWEVPEAHAADAASRASRLMLEALGAVCKPCPPRVRVDIRKSWAKSDNV